MRIMYLKSVMGLRTDFENNVGFKFELLTWDMDPGDCLVHHSLAVHGAPGISSQSGRRRAYATRWFGEDVRFDPRPGIDLLFTFELFLFEVILFQYDLICYVPVLTLIS